MLTPFGFFASAAASGTWGTAAGPYALAGNDGPSGGNSYRNWFAAATVAKSGSKVRIWIRPPSSSVIAFGLANSFVGHAAGSGDAYDFDGTQVRVTWDGGNSAKIFTTGGADYCSDEIDYTVDETKALIVALDIYNAAGTNINKTYLMTGNSAAQNCYSKGSVQEAGTTNVTGYGSWNGGGGVIAVPLVEVYG